MNLRKAIHRYCGCLYSPEEFDIQNSEESRIRPYSEVNESSSIFKTSDFGPKYSYQTMSLLSS